MPEATDQGAGPSDQASDRTQAAAESSRGGGRGRTTATSSEDVEATPAEEVEEGAPARIETCVECQNTQQINLAPDFSDSAAQWTCGRCGAVNTARFPENTAGGVERQIQDANRHEAILSQESQARQALGDDYVDEHLQRQAEAETADEPEGDEES